MLLKLKTFANIATKCFNCHQEESEKKSKTNHSIRKLYFNSALCLYSLLSPGWVCESDLVIAFPCRNVAAPIQVFEVWRAILPVLLLLSHIQDSWCILSSSPLSAVLLPFLQKSVFVAAVLTLPTPFSHIYIPNQFLSWTLNNEIFMRYASLAAQTSRVRVWAARLALCYLTA